MRATPTRESPDRGTERLILHLTACERLTRETGRSAIALLEHELGRGTARLALAAAARGRRARPPARCP